MTSSVTRWIFPSEKFARQEISFERKYQVAKICQKMCSKVSAKFLKLSPFWSHCSFLSMSGTLSPWFQSARVSLGLFLPRKKVDHAFSQARGQFRHPMIQFAATVKCLWTRLIGIVILSWMCCTKTVDEYQSTTKLTFEKVKACNWRHKSLGTFYVC